LALKNHDRWITQHVFSSDQHTQKQTLRVGLNLLFNANMIIVISKPMTLLIRTFKSSKIAPESFTVALTNVVVNHASSLRFFNFLAAFVVLFFNLFSSFVTHGSFWVQPVEVLGTNFSKQDHIQHHKKGQRIEKTMPVNQTKFVSYRLTVSSPESETPLITRCLKFT
jgi:hypothetical protein